MAEFGRQRESWLREVLELPNGIPSDDTFSRVFQRIDPAELGSLLGESGEELLGFVNEKQVCFDGKKLKGSSPRKKGCQGLYLLNAWVAENRLCIGQQKVSDKSNEITAVPKLLDQLELAGATVSIDAMGCQKEITAQIIDKGADYLLALKTNQGSLFEATEDAFRFGKPQVFTEETKADHGREEQRICRILPAQEHLEQPLFEQWKGLHTLVQVEATRKQNSKSKTEMRYYIASDSMQKPAYFNHLVRGHWAIENHLHWHLDVTFNEDQSRVRKGKAPENLAILRKVALHRISAMKDRASLKKRRYKAALNNDYLIKVLDF